MRSIIILLALMMSPVVIAAESCNSSENREFDFWLGDWNIAQTFIGADGEVFELPARTSVTRAADGCALVERWSGRVRLPWAGMTEPAHMEGLSVRYFHQQENRWYIHWLDSRNAFFGPPFIGGFQGKVGEFTVVRETADGPRRARITFRQHDQNHVYWSLAVELAQDEWQTVWTMDMKRKTAG